MNLLPYHAIDTNSLIAQGIGRKQISDMIINLHLFPTPFKGIYYIPSQDERGGWLIEKPARALRESIAIYLGTSDFYYSCATAEEYHGISWHPSGEIHVVNTIRSGRIDLQARVERNRKKKTWRAGKIARILEFYARRIIFHKVPTIEGAKFKRTIYGDYALVSQIKKDRKRFRGK